MLENKMCECGEPFVTDGRFSECINCQVGAITPVIEGDVLAADDPCPRFINTHNVTWHPDGYFYCIADGCGFRTKVVK